MKELTIKQKAEAYDKAIKELRDFYRDYDIISGLIDVKEELANIFPEIKESKDEIIRQRIIHALHGDVLEMSEIKEATDWLEKQENKKDNLSVDFVLGCLGIKPAYKDGNAWSILLGDNIQEGICGFGGTKEEALVAFMKELIEKQGEQIPANSAKTCKDEQKPNPYSGTSFDYDGHTWGMCARDNGVEFLLDGELKAFLPLEKSFIDNVHPQPELAPKSALEAAKEEKVDNANKVEPKDYNDIDPHFGKPIDKVVPKFKVGDWVVTDKCDTVQIGAVNNGYYTLYNGMIFNMSYVDKCWHLWTIADAKDGDVLVASDGSIFLFAGVVDCACKYYVALTICNDVKINKEVDGGYWETSRAVHPATKEQRDLLFSKMHEEGYEWDADYPKLKELKARKGE